jgi:SAM-dependent MidA family methyltransferase
MELALYCPDCGFYEAEKDKVGRHGDFYTSVSVGPLFGELLAFQCARWLAEAQSAECGMRIIEAGAHDGRLAADILGWFQRQRPELLAHLEYCLLEPSARRREWQRQTLAEFSGRTHWIDSWDDPHSALRTPHFTVVLSNELLDALPARRFGWDAASRSWFEWGVAAEGDRFVWTRLSCVPPSPFLPLPSAPELLEALPDGYTLEISPAAEQWWSNAARWLKHGKLVTFDYGFGADELLCSNRPQGTLRAYRKHQQVEDILADPGLQDITAHVNFARIQQAGIAAGLQTECFEMQGQYLTRLAAEAWKPEARFGEWNQKRSRQLLTLTHPQHLGRSFRVLIQSAG